MRVKKGLITRVRPGLSGSPEVAAGNTGEFPSLSVDATLAVRSSNAAAVAVFGPGAATGNLGDLALGAVLTRRVRNTFGLGTPSRARCLFGDRVFEAAVSAVAVEDGRQVLVQFHDVTPLARAADRWKRASKKALRTAAYGSAALDNVAASVAVLDSTGAILAVNRPWRERAASDPTSAADQDVGGNYLRYCASLESYFSAAGDEAAVGIGAVLNGSQRSYSLSYPCLADGGLAWFRMVVSPLGGEAGPAGGAVVVHYDVTAEVRATEEKARQVVALQSSTDAIFIIDAAGRVDWANDAFLRSQGLRQRDSRFSEIELHQAGGPELETILAGCRRTGRPWSGEVTLEVPNSIDFTVEQTVTPILDSAGEIGYFVVAQQDITFRKQNQVRMMYLAEHDHATGLLNRKSFVDRLRPAIEQHRSAERQLAVLCIDLDRFQGTNASFGHQAGDSILAEIARRLRHLVGDTGLVARLGGDEFVVMLSRCKGRSQVSHSARQILELLKAPVEVEGQSVALSASIGVALFPSDGMSHESLLRNADLALYRAKGEGRSGFRFYDSVLEAEAGERASLERELSRAIGTRNLWIAYQPLWEVATGRIVGAEALLRWNTAEQRGIAMGRIVSIAEDSGLILPIGQWVIRNTLAQLKDWQERLGSEFKLSVNLSAVQLNHPEVPELIAQGVGSLGVAPSSFKVEITESILLHNSDVVCAALTTLHEAGVGMVLDDFGTGYSSLTYLQQFPIESVKIDCSFVRGIGRRRQDEAIVNGIVQLAHSLGLTAVAEGVETEEQLEFLKTVGCDVAQGFLVSPAVPPAEFEALFAAKVAAGVPGLRGDGPLSRPAAPVR